MNLFQARESMSPDKNSMKQKLSVFQARESMSTGHKLALLLML